MVELADTLDLGSSARACRFDSCYPHHIKTVILIQWVSRSRFLIFASFTGFFKCCEKEKTCLNNLKGRDF